MCCTGVIWPGGKTVLVPGCFGAQCSVAPAKGATVQRESELDVRGPG